jgi:DNA-binding CsgD family transcriptional regulator
MSPSPVALPEAWCRKHLSPAEQRVVELVGAGLPSKLIAARLSKSPHTVKNQLMQAMRKLGVHSRYELMAQLRPVAPPAPAAPEEAMEAFAYAI